MKYCIVVFFSIVLFSRSTRSQNGMFIHFESVVVYGDSVTFTYGWETLDPVINARIMMRSDMLMPFDQVCTAVHMITTGQDSCVVYDLLVGEYQYYLYVEDGDQLIDSTDIGIFYIDRTVFVPELHLPISTDIQDAEFFSLSGQRMPPRKHVPMVVYDRRKKRYVKIVIQ